jgi:hypothetical protein
MAKGELSIDEWLVLKKSQSMAPRKFACLNGRRLPGRPYNVSLFLAIPDTNVPVLTTINLVDGNATINLDSAHFPQPKNGGKVIKPCYKAINNPLKLNTAYITLNQRVQGSSPCAPTIDIATLSSVLQQNKIEQRRPVGRSVGSFCSPFELADGAFGERGITMEIVRIQD